jgi:hypothetical protein
VRSSTAVLIKGFTVTPSQNNGEEGIYIAQSSECTLVENDIANFSLPSVYGMMLVGSNDIKIFHDSFFSDATPVYLYQSFNTSWDNGYPSGGNYWSDYKGVDLKSGPYQNETGSDGIGDTPYIIVTLGSPRNQDQYPLMNPYGRPYYVTIKAQCNIGVDVCVNITLDGSPTNYATPHTFTVTTGTHTFTVPQRDANGHLFTQWNTGQTNTTILVSFGGTYVAYYDFEYTLTIISTPGGMTDPAPTNYSQWSGTTFNVKAIPDAGYYLDHWQLDGVSLKELGPVSVVINMNHTLEAVFKHLSSGHDVAVKYATTKTVVGQGYLSNINITTINIGSYTETFNITVYVNTTSITSQTATLESGAHVILTYAWNTSGFEKGNYTISAYATPVQGETDIADNTLVDGTVLITGRGDVNGDGGVDVLDLIIVAKALGTCLGDLKWNPNADINGDDSIDVLDLILVAKYLGT